MTAFIAQLDADGVKPDILVNNAGTIKRKPAAEHPDEWWDEVIEVNLSSQFVLSREIGRGMVERGSGKIIFTASLLTFQGGITVPGYAASKGGIGQLTKALANEWAGKGVNVNAIAPRLYRHRQHRSTPGRRGPLYFDPGTDSAGPLGHAGRFRRDRLFFWRLRRQTM